MDWKTIPKGGYPFEFNRTNRELDGTGEIRTIPAQPVHGGLAKPTPSNNQGGFAR